MKKEKIKIKNQESFFLDDILNIVKKRNEVSKEVKNKNHKMSKEDKSNGENFNS